MINRRAVLKSDCCLPRRTEGGTSDFWPALAPVQHVWRDEAGLVRLRATSNGIDQIYLPLVKSLAHESSPTRLRVPCLLIPFLVSGLNTVYGGAVSLVTFTGIGFSGADNYSEVRSVTADGSKAVGTSSQFTYPNGPFTNPRSISWTQGGGFQVLPNPPADGTTGSSHSFITASDITPDGSWIAYRARPNGTGALVAMLGAGDGSSATPLGRNGNLSSAAVQINDAGNILFGFGTDPNGLFQAFRWTAGGGYQQFTDPVGYDESLPAQRGTSSDGSVSVGDISNIDLDSGDETAHQAYRWTLTNGIVGLGYLPGGNRSVRWAFRRMAIPSSVFRIPLLTRATLTLANCSFGHRARGWSAWVSLPVTTSTIMSAAWRPTLPSWP